MLLTHQNIHVIMQPKGQKGGSCAMSFIGKIIKELPPCAENNRNSEGDFIRMPDGSIAFAYTRYRNGGHQDSAIADLAVCFSYDEGESFTAPRIFLTAEECGNARNIMSVSLIEMLDGSIGVFYLKKFGKLSCLPFLRTTRDFVTLSEESRCVVPDGYICLVNGRMRRLKNGDLIMPIAGNFHPEGGPEASYETEDNWKYPPSQGAIFLSKDDGKTFEMTAIQDCPYEICLIPADRGLQEPGCEELDDGRIYLYYRNASGRQLETYSSDGGYTWTPIMPSRFTSPPSPMSSLRMSDGNILVGYNPAPLYLGRGQRVDGVWTGGRTPYVLEIADGNMNRIVAPRAIETDEKSGFGYCSMLEVSDGILLAYCAGCTQDPNMLARLRIRKIPKNELYPK